MIGDTPSVSAGINTYNEKALHAAIKQWYAAPEDRLEVPLDGYFIDLIHGDLLVEVQTGSFLPLRKKLQNLCSRHRVRLVFPIAVEKWLVTLPAEEGKPERRRKSPKRGMVEHLFKEMVYLPGLMNNANFTLEVLLIQEEEVRRPVEKRHRRSKGFITQERRLVKVLDRRLFETPADLALLLPTGLPQPFTTRQIAKAMRQPLWLAQKMVYCLKAMGVLSPVGKHGKSVLYQQV